MTTFRRTLDLSGSRTPEQQLNTNTDNARALPMFHFVASSDRVRQVIYRAVYRFIVEDGARLVQEIERGLVAGGALAPAELAIVRAAARAGSDTDVATGGVGGDGRARGIPRGVDIEHPVTPPVSGALGALVFGAALARRDRARDPARFHVRAERQDTDGPACGPAPRRWTIRSGCMSRKTRAQRVIRCLTRRRSTGWPTAGSMSAGRWRSRGSRPVSIRRYRRRPRLPRLPRLPRRRSTYARVDGLDADRRRGLEERFGLDEGNEQEPSTWSYGLADESRANITALVGHPDVADTHNIDRAEMKLAVDAFRAEGPRFQAPSLERVPRLYTLALTVAGVAADDLRLEDIDLVFVNTVTGPGGRGAACRVA